MADTTCCAAAAASADHTPLRSRLAAELVGTAGLLAAVVGSGVMAQRLTDDGAVQLLVNALATVAVLGVLISSLGPVSGAHFNPAVTLAPGRRGAHRWATSRPTSSSSSSAAWRARSWPT